LRELLTLADLQRLSWKEICLLQERKFAAAARHLLPQTAIYRELFSRHQVDPKKISRVEDWKKLGLPLIKKRLFLDRSRDFLVRPEGKKEEVFLTYLKYAKTIDKVAAFSLSLKAILSVFRRQWRDQLTREVRQFFVPKMPAFSGGTETGRPIPVLLTARQKAAMLPNAADISAYLVVTRHFNDDRNLVAMNLFPYAPHIAWQIINLCAELRTDLNLCTASGGYLGTERLVGIAKASAPNVYSGMVEYLTNTFLPQARAADVKLGDRVVFLNGATKLLEVQREKVKEQFRGLGAKDVFALDGYGASELKALSFAECEEGSGLHQTAPLTTIVRTVKVGRVDPESDYIYDWEFTAEGEGGYAAIWNIDGAGTLLEGFFLGDHFERTATGRCPHCGLDTIRLYNINRITDLETEIRLLGFDEEKISGNKVNLVALREKLLHLPGMVEAQIVVGKNNYGLSVKYVSETGGPDELAEEIREVFHSYCEVQPHQIEKLSLTELINTGDKLKYSGIVRS